MAATLIRQGKVRDLYDLGDRLLLVASDRISAFDWIIPTPIPDKGKVLTQLSRFWFEKLQVKHHVLDYDVSPADLPDGVAAEELAGRSMIVRKCRVVPIECVARGYLVGSGWKEYQVNGTVCGIELPAGLENCDRLEQPIFTPATKAESGHDENISFEVMVDQIGLELGQRLRDNTLSLYQRGADFAREQGIIIADTKFEWGWDGDELVLIDEVLTPDSSRFWPADQYRPGANPPSFDKQFVRDYLETTEWDKNSEPPDLPEAIVEQTRAKYLESFERLTGGPLQI